MLLQKLDATFSYEWHSASGKRESGHQHWFNNVPMLHNMTIRRASFKTGGQFFQVM